MKLRLVGGELPAKRRPAADLGQYIAILDSTATHWRLQVESNAERRRYSVKVWAEGRRFELTRATPIDAVMAAIEQISENRATGRKR